MAAQPARRVSDGAAAIEIDSSTSSASPECPNWLLEMAARSCQASLGRAKSLLTPAQIGLGGALNAPRAYSDEETCATITEIIQEARELSAEATACHQALLRVRQPDELISAMPLEFRRRVLLKSCALGIMDDT